VKKFSQHLKFSVLEAIEIALCIDQQTVFMVSGKDRLIIARSRTVWQFSDQANIFYILA
jgi:hypothetical protein